MITLVYFIVDTLFTRETSFSLVSLPLSQYCFLSFIRFSRQNSFRFETVWMLRYSARFIRIEFEFVRTNFVWLFRDLCFLQTLSVWLIHVFILSTIWSVCESAHKYLSNRRTKNSNFYSRRSHENPLSTFWCKATDSKCQSKRAFSNLTKSMSIVRVENSLELCRFLQRQNCKMETDCEWNVKCQEPNETVTWRQRGVTRANEVWSEKISWDNNQVDFSAIMLLAP